MNNLGILKGLKYSLYLIFHPFNGFWDLKHEKKGNFLSSSIILLMFVIVLVLRIRITGFQINFIDIRYENIVFEISNIILPFILWCIANWAVTTLFDGEGTVKDIYIASAYTLVPVIIFNMIMLVLSNILILKEMPIYTTCDYLSITWACLLILIAIMTVHQFSMFKTILMVLLTIITMVIILAIILLFLSLIVQVYNFLYTIYFELFLKY